MTARAFHRQRPLVTCAVFLCCGLTLGILWWNMAHGLVWVGLGLSLILTVLQRLGKRPFVSGICLMILFAAMLWGHNAANPPLPPVGRYQVTGVVEGMAERRASDGRLKAVLGQVSLLDDQGNAYRVPRAYFTWYPGEQASDLPMDGQELEFSTNLYHPSPQQNPYGFDFRMYLLQRGITVGLSGARDLEVTFQGTSSVWLKARQAIGSLLDRALGSDSALPKALLIGDRDDLPQETRRDFQVTGVAHVLAVSGLHVGIFILILNQLLKRLKCGQKTQLAVMALFLLTYARLLDFSAPVVRASLLGLLLLAGRLVRRRTDPLTSLALALMIIAVVRPLDLTSIGFQLSFVAVLGIILLGDRLEYLYRKAAKGRSVPKVWHRLMQAVMTTIAASLFTAPLIALHFHQVALVGLILSPLACALVGLIMFLTLPVLAVTPFWMGGAQVLAWSAAGLSRGLFWLTDLATRWESGMMRVAAPGAVVLAASFLLLVLLSRYTRFTLRWKAGLAAFALAGTLGAQALRGPEPVRYTQLSVGSADAAILEDGESTYVIDTGSHGGDAASYLRARNRQVDTLFISHLHSDHIGGLQQLLEANIQIGQIVLPEGALAVQVEDNSLEMLRKAEEKGIPIQFLAKGDALDSGRVSMRVLWPEYGKVYPGRSANLHCLSMLWELDGHTLLTAGDLDGQYERYAATPAQLLKIAHHGSKHSTSREYLQAVSPQVALLSMSASRRERATEVLARLEDMGVQVLETPASGALTLAFYPDGPRIQGHLRQEEP